jgi:predicted O-methyltransferase YrrM
VSDIEEQSATVDDYLVNTLVGADEALVAARAASRDAGLPEIEVAPNQGKLLYLLASSIGAASILEIGTLGGYSSIWLARALVPGGAMVTLEYAPKHAAVARQNIERAGLADRVEVIEGAALDTLPTLGDRGPFDFVFIDADKENNPRYVEHALGLTHPGSLIVVDNVVRGGHVADAADDSPAIVGTRACLELMGTHPKLDSTAIQTVGSKGWDGFAIARVR